MIEFIPRPKTAQAPKGSNAKKWGQAPQGSGWVESNPSLLNNDNQTQETPRLQFDHSSSCPGLGV